jgi:DNA polymerase-3 subunit epsilon
MFRRFVTAGREAKRRRLQRQLPPGPLRDYLSVPLPDTAADIRSVPVLSLDFETSGLNAQQDHMVSVGYVVMHDGFIDLSTACHQLIKTGKELTEESVVIHKITDDAISEGASLTQVINELLALLAGKVMLAHNAKIENDFIKQACLELYGVAPYIPTIDTLRIARIWFERRNKEIEQGDLRLFNLRKRYGLPAYQAHNALSDAISTAELLQAQIEHMGGAKKLPLRQFMT